MIVDFLASRMKYNLCQKYNMLNIFVLALGLTALYYFYNNSIGLVQSNTDYLIALIGFTIGLSLLYQFVLPKGTEPPNVLKMVGLDRSPPSPGPNGGHEVPCYHVPFKVLRTQYGDRALLAGYNEMVQPYQTGASGKYNNPEFVSRIECTTLGYDEKELSADATYDK